MPDENGNPLPGEIDPNTGAPVETPPDANPPTTDPANPDPVSPPDPPKSGKTIGGVFREKAETAATSAESTKAALEADAKAKADQDADRAKDAEIAAGLKAIGKPFVETLADGSPLIHYSTTKADGSPGFSSEAGVGPDTVVPDSPTA